MLNVKGTNSGALPRRGQEVLGLPWPLLPSEAREDCNAWCGVRVQMACLLPWTDLKHVKGLS